MTLTARTTRGRTRKALTAMVAVFGVMVAMLLASAPAANAEREDDGDHGQPKVTICHYVHGLGETKDGYNVITIAQSAWDRGHSTDDEDEVTKNWNHKDGMDQLYNGTSCPTVPTVTGVGRDTDTHGTLCWRDVTYGPFTTGEITVTLPGLQMTQERADALAQAAAELKARIALALMLSDFPRHSDGPCAGDEIVGHGEAQYTHPAFCYAGVTQGPVVGEPVTVDLTGEWADQETADAAAQAQAEKTAMDQVNAYVDRAYPGHVDGACTPPGTVYTQSASAGGTIDLCLVDGTTQAVTYTGTATATSPLSDADALFIAQGRADEAAQADLVRQTPAGATTGACGLVAVAPVEPATVAPVEPATVAVPQAATVPLPATVPAGDGSSVPRLPVYGWALLVLGTAALAAATVRLSGHRAR